MLTDQTPVTFLLVVALFALAEFAWRRRSGRGYSLGALGANLGVMMGQFVSRFITGGLVTGAMFAVFAFAPVEWAMGDWRTWVAGFFVLEFFYYWQHRFSHTIRWLWTSHAVHHSPNEFTLPAAFRLGWTGTISGGWLVLLPMALMGFHPVVIATLMAVNLRYQYFLHTEAVGKLGVLEWVFNTPSHHRVHHGSNPAYLDTNFGGVLIVFDRLFGTFVEERDDEPVRYGLTTPVTSNNPFVIAFHEWANLWRDLGQVRSARGAWRALFGRPSDLARGAPPDAACRQAPALT
ncbi:MAG: sterol desaturase family protein [Erythrobacter sp.]|jgi:sterol desaturase/sphingolipid hydroxylase (fatty acid hydroxylase superfamily)|nr:sterol desaturase family protein [Erythrobacter sp.]